MVLTVFILFYFSCADVHTHTHPFNGPLSGTTLGEPVPEIWILLKQETVSDSGISWAICKSALRSRPRQHPTTQFFTGQMPFLLPNQQRQITEGKRRSYILNKIKWCMAYDNVLWRNA